MMNKLWAERRAERNGAKQTAKLFATWAAGMTTTHRDHPTITETLASIGRAGWSKVRVFADGPCHVPDGVEVTRRSTRVGGWANWSLGLAELVLSHPDADFYAMFEDDLIMARNVREYVEKAWQDDWNILSLYCSAGYSLKHTKRIDTKSGLLGALALVFDSRTAHRIVNSDLAVSHRKTRRGTFDQDGALGRWAFKNDVNVVVVAPSLVQHTGQISTIHQPGVRSTASNRRMSDTFPGEDFDALSRLAAPNVSTFAITGIGRCGSKFLAQTMDRSNAWTVRHEPGGRISSAEVIQERFQREGYGEVNTYLRWTFDDLNVDRKGVIVRNPQRHFVSWYTKLTRQGKTLTNDDYADFFNSRRRLREHIRNGAKQISFEQMTTDPNYLNSILRYFGIEDVTVSADDLKPVNATPNPLTFDELPDEVKAIYEQGMSNSVPPVTPKERAARIGLVGYNCATGLGYMNRDLNQHLPIHKWLIHNHPRLPTLDITANAVECPTCSRGKAMQADFLKQIDVLLFVENPLFGRLLPMAKDAGVRVVCVPMWEWYKPEYGQYIDQMIYPTEWSRKYIGVEGPVVPWPLDVDALPFRERSRCDTFLHISDGGGVRGHRGSQVVWEAAQEVPESNWIVQTRKRNRIDQSMINQWPANVTVKTEVKDRAELYSGDVCVQVPRWEGLGLTLLECQATGMPLVTTDAAPMNEHNPYRAIEASEDSGKTNQSVPAFDACPTKLAEAVRELRGSDIRQASHQARQFIEQQHNWNTTPLRDILQVDVFTRK